MQNTNQNKKKQTKKTKQKLAIAITSTIVATVLIITSILALATWGFTAESKADLWSFKKPVQSTPTTPTEPTEPAEPTTPDTPTEPTEPQVPTGQIVVGNTYKNISVKDLSKKPTEADYNALIAGLTSTMKHPTEGDMYVLASFKDANNIQKAQLVCWNMCGMVNFLFAYGDDLQNGLIWDSEINGFKYESAISYQAAPQEWSYMHGTERRTENVAFDFNQLTCAEVYNAALIAQFIAFA